MSDYRPLDGPLLALQNLIYGLISSVVSLTRRAALALSANYVAQPINQYSLAVGHSEGSTMAENCAHHGAGESTGRDQGTFLPSALK